MSRRIMLLFLVLGIILGWDGTFLYFHYHPVVKVEKHIVVRPYDEKFDKYFLDLKVEDM